MSPLSPLRPPAADLWDGEEAVRFALSKGPQVNIRVLFNKVKWNTGWLACEIIRPIRQIAPT
jgi:hypothetical protein